MEHFGRIVGVTHSVDKKTCACVFHQEGAHHHTVVILDVELPPYDPRRTPEIAQHVAPLDVLDYLNMKRVSTPVPLSEVSRLSVCVYLPRTFMVYLGMSDVPREYQSPLLKEVGSVASVVHSGRHRSALLRAFVAFHAETLEPYVSPLRIGNIEYLPHDPFR